MKNYIREVMLFLGTACSTVNIPPERISHGPAQNGFSCAIQYDQESVTYICDVDGDNAVDRIVQLNSDGNQGTIEFILGESCSLRKVKVRSSISGNFDCVGSLQELTEEDTCFILKENILMIDADLRAFCDYFRTNQKVKNVYQNDRIQP